MNAFEQLLKEIFLSPYSEIKLRSSLHFSDVRSVCENFVQRSRLNKDLRFEPSAVVRRSCCLVRAVTNNGTLATFVWLAKHRERGESLHEAPHVLVHPRYTGSEVLESDASH